MISDKETVCPYNLLNSAHKKKGVTAGIVTVTGVGGGVDVGAGVSETISELLPPQAKTNNKLIELVINMYFKFFDNFIEVNLIV